MPHLMLQKIETIKTKISALQSEQSSLTGQLKSSISNLFDDATLSRCDFTALVGGIRMVQKTLIECSSTDQTTIDTWNAEGAVYLQKMPKIKNTRPKKDKKNPTP